MNTHASKIAVLVVLLAGSYGPIGCAAAAAAAAAAADDPSLARHALREPARFFTAADAGWPDATATAASHASAGAGSGANVIKSRLAEEFHNALEHINVAAARPAPDATVTIAARIAPRIAPRNGNGNGRPAAPQRLRNGDTVVVEWAGVPGPDWGDFVAVLPAPANASGDEPPPPLWAATPLKYAPAARAATHLRSGSGRLKFRLISYRTDAVFAFMRGGALSPRLAAATAPLRLENPNEPLQGRLALAAGGPTEMSVTWSTRDAARPTVRWGEAEGKLNHEAPGTSRTYTRDEMCGGPARGAGWLDPGLIHTAVMTGLVPGRRYYYSFGDPQWGWSRVFSFRAAPAAGQSGTVKFLVAADMGQAEPDRALEQTYYAASLNTTRRMATEPGCRLVVHAGDVSYAKGYVSQWDNFHAQLEPIAARCPYMLVPGNHERNWPGTGDRFDGRAPVYDSGGECGVAYTRRFAMPSPVPDPVPPSTSPGSMTVAAAMAAASGDRPWYAFDFGPVRFVMYSTEHALRPGTEQHAFIADALASADRAATPWLVLVGHRPLAVASTNAWAPDGDLPAAAEARAALEPLLLDHRVDVTLHGHHHSLQRSCAAARGRCTGGGGSGTADAAAGVEDGGWPGGPVHLVVGNAGAPLSTNVPLSPDPIWQAIKFWWGYVRAEASATRLAFEAVSDADGRLLDSVTLRKPEGWGAAYMASRRQ